MAIPPPPPVFDIDQAQADQREYWQQVSDLYPKRPEILDDEGMLLDRYKNAWLNVSAPTNWLGNMLGAQSMEASRARDVAGAENSSSLQTALGQLAMKGGLRGGAQERLASDFGRSSMASAQDLARQDLADRMKLMGQGQQMAVDAERFNNEGKLKVNQWNVEQALKERQAKREEDLRKYEADMAAKGAERQAQATENADSGSSFICTALRADGLMSTKESCKMLKLMLSGIGTHAEFFSWYFRVGKKAIDTARRQKFDFSVIKWEFVDSILRIWETHGIEAAKSAYAYRADKFIRMWLGETGFTPRMAEQSRIRSLFYLPAVFVLPGTWKWLAGFLGTKAKRTTKKLYRAFAA